MRVLHIYRTYLPDPTGGLQEAIRQIALASSPHAIESRIFTLSPRPRPAELDLPEGRVTRSRSWMAPASCDIGGPVALVRFRRAADWADVLHFHFPWPFADVLRFLGCPNKTAVMTYHSDVVGKGGLGALYLPLARRMLSSMRAIVATSPAYARTSPLLAAQSPRVRVIPLGIDRDSYPQDGDDSVLDRLDLAPALPFILFLGVLRAYKGLHALMRAASRLDAKVVVAGSGPEDAALRALADRAGAGNVSFAGQVSEAEKVSLLRHCRALVLPSHLRSEAFGMVLVEASMFGKPMISCEIGTGTSYVNADGVTGRVVAPDDPQALASAMQELLADAALAARMGEAARARYASLFSAEALGRAYAQLYVDVSEAG